MRDIFQICLLSNDRGIIDLILNISEDVMALQNAHSGYEFQDIFTALRLVDVLLSRVGDVRVDEKLFTGDLFDDLTTTWNDGRRTREQLKHSMNPSAIQAAVFTSVARDCRLDMIVESAVKNRNNGLASYEYRLISSDLAPTDKAISDVLRYDPLISPSQAEFSSKCYRFDIDKLWPKDETSPQGPWKRVVDFALNKGLTREDFTWFAESFILELEMPRASFDLASPGVVEKLLLDRVTREVGAGSYPNTEHSAVEVAAALISAARAARGGSDVVTREVLLRRTRLRDDFGSVARAFPVEASKEIEVKHAAEGLLEATKQSLEDGASLLVLGPPGQGKTWSNDKLARTLQQEGWLVANHYCYLNSAEDESRDKRVRLDAVIGSLLAQIVEQEPWCVAALMPRYAANSETLVAALQKIHENYPDKRIALLVDGLDHVTRVLGATTGRPDPATELAQELSLLDLPQNTVLVVACQAGTHDTPLKGAGAHIYELPAWEQEDVLNLGIRMGIVGSIAHPDQTEAKALLQPDDPQLDKLMAELNKKSKGNALYATYCFSELRRAYETQPDDMHDFIASLQTLPAFEGTMKSYYEYLIQAVPADALIAANALAVLDFAVTREELEAIYPQISSFIAPMVDRLAPVLIERGMQGGVRVYHESFQRFLLETKIVSEEQRRATILPIISWLRAKGFFQDARSFRFLAPLLAEVSDDRSICDLINDSFVAEAVQACYGEAATIKNIVVAAEAAVRLQDWPALIRYVELGKEMNSYAFYPMERVLGEYSDIPIELNGVSWLTERLLFEGRPVFPPRIGLQLCEAIDISGGVPPWQEYLDFFEQTRDQDNVHRNRNEERAIGLAEFRGILRTRSNPGAIDLAYWLDQNDLPSPFQLTKILVDVFDSASLILEVIRRLSKKRRSGYLIALAENLPRFSQTQRLPTVKPLLSRAVRLGLSPSQTIRALELGAEASSLQVIEADLINQTNAVLMHGAEWKQPAVRRWVVSVFVVARTSTATLDRIRLLIQGPGWYRCWLEYVVELARFNAAPSESILPTFKLLVSEDGPFVGKPRACDLYSIHSLIANTLRMGLRHVSDTEWPQVLSDLKQVSDNTTTSLFNGSHSGPLVTELLLSLSTDFTNSSRKDATTTFVEALLDDVSQGRAYYETHADYSLLRARLSIKHGELIDAKEYWAQAARFNICYGERKDGTIFELLDPMPELIKYDIKEARQRIKRLKPLVLRVIRHTDLKGTRHALPQWWDLVAKADGVSTGDLIAKQMLETPNRQAGQLQDAQFKLYTAQLSNISPIVGFACRLSLGYQSESGMSDTTLLRSLRTVSDSGISPGLASDAVSSLFQDRITDGSYDKPDVNGFKSLARVASELGGHTLAVELSKEASSDSSIQPVPVARINSRIKIDWGDSPIDITRAIRRWSQQSYDLDRSDAALDRTSAGVVEAIGWRLLVFCQQNKGETAENLLRFLIEHLEYRHPARVLNSLAEGFERHGLKRMAVIAYVAAYTKTRGSGGWHMFGGKECEHYLHAATSLDHKLALEELGMAVVGVLNGTYYATPGVSHALVEAFCNSEVKQSMDLSPFDLWDAAASIIEDRLPAISISGQDDDPYDPTGSKDDTREALEAAVAATVISSLAHPEKPLKRGSLLGAAWLTKLLPQVTVKGFQMALSSELDPGGKSWLLWVLLHFESEPFAITQACKEILGTLSQCNLLTVRALAARLLVRAEITPQLPPATTIAPDAGFFEIASEQQRMNYHLAEEGLLHCAAERIFGTQELAPELGPITLAKFGQKINTKEFKEKYRSQIEDLSHPSSRRSPDAYTLEQEEAERILQEVAAGMRVLLAKEEGIVRDPSEYEGRLADILLDNPELPLRIAASRVPRPDLLPEFQRDQIGIDLPIVKQGPYKDWLVLAFHEMQITPSQRYDQTPRKTIFIEGGAEVCPVSSSHTHPTPYGFGVALVWLSSKNEGQQAGLTGVPTGPLAGIEGGTVPKYFGVGAPRLILTPHLKLARILGLKAGNILDGLTLIDEEGKKGIVSRTWRDNLISGEDFGPAYPLIEGADLLIRPDLLKVLEKKFNPNVVKFCSSRQESVETESP